MVKSPLILLILWLPALTGAFFGPVVELGHHLYRTGKINVQGAGGIEFLYLAFAALTFLASAKTGVELLRERKAWGIACAAASIVLGIILLGVGFQRGAALLYAT